MPRRLLTPKQIASIAGRTLRHGEQSRLARAWGVASTTISYHCRGGKVLHGLRRPRKPSAA